MAFVCTCVTSMRIILFFSFLMLMRILVCCFFFCEVKLGLLLDEMLLELVCYWLFPVFLEAFNKIYSHGFSATDTKFVALSNMYYYEFWINICKALLIVAMTYI